MSASQAIAKDLESPEALDNGTLEMILYLTQRAISDLKEISQQNLYSQNFTSGSYRQQTTSPHKDPIKQV